MSVKKHTSNLITGVTLFTLVLFTLVLFTLASAATAQRGGGTTWLDESQAIELIRSGKGWSELKLYDRDAKEKGPGEIVFLVSPSGIDDLPVSEQQKTELREDFGVAPSPSSSEDSNSELMLIHKNLMESAEQGSLPSQYEQYADSTESCFGWSDKTKTKNWNFNEWSQQQNFSLGGGVSGNYSVNVPISGEANLVLEYRIKKTFCAPYKFKFKKVRAWGNVNIAGDSDLEASVTLMHHWEREWQLMNPRLGTISFWVGPIPVWIDFNLPTYAGIELDTTITGTLGVTSDLGATGTFDYTCDTNNCTGSHNFQESFTSDAVTGSLELEVEAQAYARMMVRAELYDDSILYAEVGAKGFVAANLWGFYGNNCGDADGDGQNETVEALVVDAEAGYDWIYGIGGALVSDRTWTSEGSRYPLGFWDLLGEGNSTALSPMVIGPDSIVEGESADYTIKMRSCFPFADRVNLAVDPGFVGNKFIAQPQSTDPAQNSTQFSRVFNHAQTRDIIVTATDDAKGRDFQVSTQRTLEILPLVVAPQILTQPQSQTRDFGTTAGFTVSASGTSPIYRWYRNGQPLNNGGHFSGVTTRVLIVTNVDSSVAGSYHVVVSNSVGAVTSQTATLTVVNQGPEIDVLTNPASQPLASGAVFSFPSTPEGVATSALFDICNNGDQNLVLSNPTSMVSGAGFFQLIDPAASVAPGTCTNMRVRFHVAAAGTYAGLLQINSNDSDESPYQIQLQGTATHVGAAIKVLRHYDGVQVQNGHSYTYPPTPVTVPVSVAFDICNDGTTPLVIEDPENLVGPLPFRQLISPPASIESGSCHEVRARFHTVTAGTYQGEIRILSNDPTENPFVIELHGTATN